jgi:hypothetical protein
MESDTAERVEALKAGKEGEGTGDVAFPKADLSCEGEKVCLILLKHEAVK